MNNENKIETVAGTVNTAESNKSVKGNVSKRTRKISNFDKIRLRAVNLFKYSIDKTAAEKALCLSKALFYYSGKMTYNADDFEKEYLRRVNVLLDSTSFCNYCEARGFKNSQGPASHIVFYYSKTKIGKLLLNGDYSIFNSYKEWECPIPFMKACHAVAHPEPFSFSDEVDMQEDTVAPKQNTVAPEQN